MILGVIGTLKRNSFWRHWLPWSYRVDLFLLLLILYSLVFVILGATHHYSINASRSAIGTDLTLYKSAVAELRPLFVAFRDKGTLSDEDRAKIKAIEIPSRPDVENSPVFMLPAVEDRKDEEELISKEPILGRKILEVTRLRTVLLSEIIGSYFYLGQTVVVALFILFLPIALLTFSIINVFHSRETHVVLRHPVFIVLLIELLSLVALLISFACLLESTASDSRQLIEESGILKPHSWFERYEYIPRPELVLPSLTSKNHALLGSLMIFLGVVTWISCGLWIIRRFGLGLFLGCSTAVIVIGLGLVFCVPGFDASRDKQWMLFDFSFFRAGTDQVRFLFVCAIWFVVFVAIFLLGLLTGFWRKQFICTGYIGVVLATLALLATTLQVPELNLLSFLWLLLVVIIFVALVEAGMKRAMFNFLYAPQ